VSTLVWLVLGYAFYSRVYAAAGSMVERQDQVQSLVLRLSLPMLFGYIMALTGARSGSPSALLKVLAYLPPTAPFAMPVVFGFKDVTWWEFLASAIISLLCTIGVARVTATVYRRAILRTGARVRLREVFTRADHRITTGRQRPTRPECDFALLTPPVDVELGVRSIERNRRYRFWPLPLGFRFCAVSVGADFLVQ